MSQAPPEFAAEAEQAAALDPHSVDEVTAPPTPDKPAEWITRGLAVKWLDFGIYQIERVIVVYMLAMMSVAMFLDMFYLSLVKTDESNLANFILRWQSRDGSEVSEAARLAFTEKVILAELVCFVLLCFVAVTTRMKGRDLLTRAAATTWVITACLAFAEFVQNYPPITVFRFLLVGTLALTLGQLLVTDIRTASGSALWDRRLQTFGGMLVATPILWWLFGDLPENYSFAQHRSLFWLLWVGFLGASMATYQRSHLSIDFVRKLVKGPRASKLYSVLSLLVTLTFTLAFLYVAHDYVFNEETGAYYAETVKGEIPDWQKVGVIPLALAVMSGRFALQALEDLLAALRPAPATPARKEA